MDRPDDTARGFPVAQCRACDADIIWARTSSGKAMPVDAALTAGANVLLRWEGSDVAARVLNASHAFGTRDTRLSHFVTCPKADEWRRKNGRAMDPVAARRRIRGS